MQGYRAAVSYMDYCIGQIRTALQEHGLSENTMIIFLSDNGGGIGSDNSPLRGRKGLLVEGGIRVPCIIKLPNEHEVRNTDLNSLCSALDIFPTILEVVGIDAPNRLILDGHSLLPQLSRGNSASTERALFWDFRGSKAVRYGPWKYLQTDEGKQLYDLSEDINESTDLSMRLPDTLLFMQQKYAAWLQEMKSSEPRGPFRDY